MLFKFKYYLNFGYFNLSIKIIIYILINYFKVDNLFNKENYYFDIVCDDKMKDINGISQENLKKTLLGHDNYLFLINDSAHELDQHFNPNYESKFDSNEFLENHNFKKELISKYYDYYFFVIPDKSLVCKEFLPFETTYLKRNVDLIEDSVDFIDYLDKDDYFKYDSHINYEGGKKLSFKFLNYIDNDFTIDKFNKLIDNAETHDKQRIFDLVHEINWSYSEKLKENFPETKIFTIPQAKNLTSIEDFPEIFKWCGSRKSLYYKNEDSYSDLRVLIFCASSFKLLEPYLSLYFKEIFFYWDHGKINMDVIRWFDPDLILEIRAERFIETAPVPKWILNKENNDLSNRSYLNNLCDENYQLKNQLKDLNKELKKLNKQLKKSDNENVRLEKIIDNKENFIDEILNSNSWKITKPLRKLKKFIK